MVALNALVLLVASSSAGIGAEHPAWLAELARSSRAISVECEALLISAARPLPPLGAGRLLAARTEEGKAVLAVVGETHVRISPELEFGDRLSLRGRAFEHGQGVFLFVEGLKRLSRPSEKPPEPGSLEEALQGPFPFPGILELAQGRRMIGRVLGVEGQSLRVRASLAEIKVPLAELRSMARTGGGTSFRPRDGRIDFLASIAPESLREVLPIVSELAWSELAGKGQLRANVLRGVRVASRFGLIVRSKELGDLLLMLGSPGRKGTAVSQLVSAASALKHGDDIAARVRKVGTELVIPAEEDALLVWKAKEGGLVTPSPWGDDPEWRQIPPARRGALDTFINKLSEDPPPETVLAGLLELEPASQRIAIKTIARSMDAGWETPAALLKLIVEKLPAEKIPDDVVHAALRGVFSQAASVRSACAEILGAMGCREGLLVLEEAKKLFPSDRGNFHLAADKAIEKIRMAPPRLRR